MRASGIIPTRMGTRSIITIIFTKSKDHPHAYGDKLRGYCLVLSSMGSSPRVWGQVYPRFPDIYKGRIIPTRMGTSYGDIVLYSLPWDHPHAYGDKTKLSYRFHIGAGSSPRVWGQVPVRAGQCQHYRIIPTRVGTRLQAQALYYHLWDHPHACGDK